MKKIFRNSLFVLAAAATVVSCADYNEIDNFTAQPDPTVVAPYKDYKEVKSYIDREKYPNLTLGAMLKVADFNKQELAHAAAVTNFDNISFGSTLMSGAIVNGRGIMNFIDMKDLLDHVQEINAEVFGSPIAANANQADDWINTLTAPVEIKVEYVSDMNIDYSKVDKFTGKGKGSIVKFEGENVLQVGARNTARIVEGFDVDPLGKYTITFYVHTKTSKDNAGLVANFCGNPIMDSSGKSQQAFTVAADKWVKVTIEATPGENATEGYLEVSVNPNVALLFSTVKVGHYPDNHRDQTPQELSDTIRYALDTWCDGLMKINEGRIKLFDLIDDALDTNSETEDGLYNLKHSTDSKKIFWQDILGNEEYAPAVAKSAREAFERYGGDPSELKLFISESELNNEKKFESLKHWINIWDAKGAKIEGITAKFSSTFSYYEDPAKQQAQVAEVDKMLENLASTGKLIRLSNFDIRYIDINGSSVKASEITNEQRQNLADFYAYIIKSYMSKIPADKQAGICKGNLVDTASEPLGLWALDKKDWVRTAIYKAFCDALSGK